MIKSNKLWGTLFLSVLLSMIIFNSCKKYTEYYVVDNSKCSLCKSCLTVCGHHAISYIEDSVSTSDKVVIDPKKCVGCGECVKVCTSRAIYSEN